MRIVFTILSTFICMQNFAQDADMIIRKIDQQLQNGNTTITKVLTNDSLMYLHSLTAFRKVIESHARAEKISIAGINEPGTRITVKAVVTDKQGKPVKNAIVYFYQTSDKGWYSDTAAHILINSGDMNHARLFGYLKTDDEGKFSFETIRPKGYPRSDLAAHIHIHFRSENNVPLHGSGELQFDDDPRMTPARRKKSIEEGFLISKNSGTVGQPVYEYRIVVE